MTIYTVPQILDIHVAQKTRPTVEREPPETETFGDDADEERRSLPSQKDEGRMSAQSSVLDPTDDGSVSRKA